MSQYNCKSCGKIFKEKRNLENHINKRVCKKRCQEYICTICNRKFSNKQSLEYHIDKNVCSNKGNNICEYCNKQYSGSSSLWNHKEKFCKMKAQALSDKNVQKKLEDQVKLMQAEMNEMRRAMETTIVNNTININNIKNNNNNNNHNNNNTLNVNFLVKFGSEDVSKLTMTDMHAVLDFGFYAVNALVKKMHFDPNTPENHNVCFNNLKDNYGTIFDGTSWITKDKNEIIDTLIDDKRFIIEESLNTKAFKKLSKLKQDAVTRMMGLDLENEHIIKTKKELKYMMYDNRKYPQAAIKKCLH